MTRPEIDTQRELFSVVDEFFQRATGKTAEAFAGLDSFGDTVRANAEQLGPRTVKAFEWGIPELQEFYKAHLTDLLVAARSQGGIKVVLGGGSRFRKTQLNAVRRLLLYADCVLIPDPVLPWLETERAEERFRNVNLLEAMFFLLRLKPLIFGDFASPPLIVFQSWERSLALNDEQTTVETDAFISNVLSRALNIPCQSMSEVMGYARTAPEHFLEEVDERKLFVGPGGNIGELLVQAIARYKDEIRRWRSPEYLKSVAHFSDAETVCLALFERLEPQYHMVVNANELRAQPLLALNAHAHYFSVSANAIEDMLVENELVQPSTRATIAALASERFEWLGNAPIPAIAEMRLKNENEQFRSELSKSVSALNETSLTDLDRVASEVSRSVGSLLNSHKAQAQAIEQKYRPKYLALAGSSWLTLGTLMIPFLAPYAAVVPPLLVSGKYIQTKLEERRERRSLTGSLVGILAAAEESSSSLS